MSSSLLGDLCFPSWLPGWRSASIPRLGHVQTSTRDEQESLAGVKDYRLTYFKDDYTVRDTDLLAAFRVVPQPGVPPEEAGAAIAALARSCTWNTVWTPGLLVDAFGSSPPLLKSEIAYSKRNRVGCYIGFNVGLSFTSAKRVGLMDDWLRRERFVFIGWSGLLLFPTAYLALGGWLTGTAFVTSRFTHGLASSYL